MHVVSMQPVMKPYPCFQYKLLTSKTGRCLNVQVLECQIIYNEIWEVEGREVSFAAFSRHSKLLEKN